MNRRPQITLLILAGASLFLARPALAQGDLRLGWNNCRADGGVANMSFACGTNTGTEVLVGSFVLPVDVPQAVALEAEIYVAGEPTYTVCDGPGCPPMGAYDVPPWWQFQTGGCRSTALSTSFNFTSEPFASSTHCMDVWYGNAFSGFAYDYPYLTTKSARLRVVGAVADPNAVALVAGQEYYGFQVLIRHTKTVGTGFCDGCCTPMTILFGSGRVDQPSGVGDIQLSASGYDFFTTWQSPATNCVTPTRNRTWGGIKAMYR